MARENVQTDDNEGEDLEPTPYQNDYRRNLAIDDDLDESNFQERPDISESMDACFIEIGFIEGEYLLSRRVGARTVFQLACCWHL